MIHCWRGGTRKPHDLATAEVKPVSQPVAVGMESTVATTTSPEAPRHIRIIGLKLAQGGVSAARIVVQDTRLKNLTPKHSTAVM